MKKLSHCQIPYLVKSRKKISGKGFIPIHHDYFIFCKRCFEYFIFLDSKRNYFVNIHFDDDRGVLVSLDFRVYGKRAFGFCPFRIISDFISLMYSEYVLRTNN